MKLLACFACLALALTSIASAASPEFFAFDNGVGRGVWTPEKQASTLKDLGYDGISYNYTNPADLAVWIKTYKEHGLKIYGLYVYSAMDKADHFPPGFRDAIKLLKGSETVIWMTVLAPKDKSRTYDDSDAVKVVHEMADLASENSLRVALYGHAGMYVATGVDSARVARLADRSNVGATINLCHEFMTKNGDKLDETLKIAAPIAFRVSINGVDVASKQYILRLDQGDFDVAAYLKKLAAAGYSGPIGLQCYSIKGDPYENLKLSMQAWKKIRPQ